MNLTPSDIGTVKIHHKTMFIEIFTQSLRLDFNEVVEQITFQVVESNQEDEIECLYIGFRGVVIVHLNLKQYIEYEMKGLVAA